jgi:SAM-dependent methyltransferase
MINRHWHIVDDDIMHTRLPAASFDFVTCVSVLEHITDHRAAMRSMLSLLAPGGHLVLTCPYTDSQFVENCYDLPDARAEYRDSPYICRSYSRGELDQWLSDSDVELVEQEYWRIENGPVHATGEWLFPAERVDRDQAHQLSCLLLRRRNPGSREASRIA